MTRMLLLFPIALTLVLAACGGDEGRETTQGAGGTAGAGGGSAEDLDMTDADFACILDGTNVRKFYLINKLGHMDDALEAANSANGAVYPVGTVIQVIPTEAMVKRRAGFSPATRDWEFFFLEIKDKQTTIKVRGTDEVVNGLGNNCLACHSKAAPQWDLLCEEGHGCDSLPFTLDQIKMIQESDPRCKN